MDEIIKCLKCGQVLISGKGMVACFSAGSSIGCRKCGNKYTFGKAAETIQIESDGGPIQIGGIDDGITKNK